MPSGSGRKVPQFIYLIAGLEVGVVGGLAMVAWLGSYCALRGRSVWAFANLLATTFYDDRVLDRGFGFAALAGTALQLFSAGMAGLVFASFCGRFGRRVLLAGVLWGLVWYYLSFRWVWSHWNPLVLLYSPDRSVLLGHLLLGFCLAAVPRAARGIADGSREMPRGQAEPDPEPESDRVGERPG